MKANGQLNGHAAGDQLPPHSRDAERSVLGSMLRDNHVIDDLAVLLREQSFYQHAHQMIFAAALHLWNESKPVDLTTLAELLKQRSQIEDVGGYSYLGELWDAAPTAANWKYYAEIVRDKGTIRGLIQAGTSILREAHHPATSPQEALESAEKQIQALAESMTNGESATLQEVMRAEWDRIDSRHEQKAGSLGIPTGFAKLDEKTGGLHSGEVVIVAARPSIGKTSLGTCITRNVAGFGCPAMFVSLEQSRVDLAERMLVAEAEVDGYKVRTGKLSATDYERLIQANGRLPSRLVHIDDYPAQSMLQIASKARRAKRRHGIRLLVIDYLQLVNPEERRAPRHEQIGAVSRRLKCLALELQICVIAMSQLNRQSEERPDHKPRLSDLRDSGNIEQDADVAILLHRPDAYGPTDRPGEVDCDVAKNRNGPTGTVTLSYRKEFMRFDDLATGAPPWK